MVFGIGYGVEDLLRLTDPVVHERGVRDVAEILGTRAATAAPVHIHAVAVHILPFWLRPRRGSSLGQT